VRQGPESVQPDPIRRLRGMQALHAIDPIPKVSAQADAGP